MNRTVLLGAALVVLAGLGYYQFSYLPTQRVAQEAATAASAAEAEAAAAAKAAEDAAKAATEAAATAGEAAADAATEAAGAVSGAVDATTNAATEAAGAVTDAATGAATAVGDAATMVWDATKLTGEEVLARIQAAPIADTAKMALTATYNSVKDNAAGVQMVLDQLKTDMGL